MPYCQAHSTLLMLHTTKWEGMGDGCDNALDRVYTGSYQRQLDTFRVVNEYLVQSTNLFKMSYLHTVLQALPSGLKVRYQHHQNDACTKGLRYLCVLCVCQSVIVLDLEVHRIMAICTYNFRYNHYAFLGNWASVITELIGHLSHCTIMPLKGQPIIKGDPNVLTF